MFLRFQTYLSLWILSDETFHCVQSAEHFLNIKFLGSGQEEGHVGLKGQCHTAATHILRIFHV